MNTALSIRDPLVYKFPMAKEETDYNAWPDGVVAASLANPEPTTEHSQVAAEVHVALAVSLFKDGKLTSARAARLARMSLETFLAHVSAQGIPVVDYDPAELDDELATLKSWR